MFEKTLMLENFEDVKKFVDIAASKNYDIELMQGKYVINAKSIMGVFSLDLTRSVTVVAHTDSIAEIARQTECFSAEHKK